MTTDETIQAIEALPKNGRLIIDAGGRDEVKTPLTTAKIIALAAELKEYREFVGAIYTVGFEEWHGHWLRTDEPQFAFYDSDGERVATGTDPFDAFCNMQKEIKLSEVEVDDESGR